MIKLLVHPNFYKKYLWKMVSQNIKFYTLKMGMIYLTEKSKLERSVKEFSSRRDKLESHKKSIEDSLKLYDELKNKGFDYNVLDELRKTSEKYGGVEGLFKAINTYKELKDIEVEAIKYAWRFRS